jgi:hypothetical protein
MKFVSVRDLRLNPGNVWKDLNPDEPLVVLSRGKPIALLCGTDADSLEKTLDGWRHVQFQKALRASQESALKTGVSSLAREDIDREIKRERKGRRKMS